MENFLFSANAVLPIFIVMAIGCFLKHKKILKDEFYAQASRFVFLIATPALLFKDTSAVDFYSVFDAKFIGFILSAIVLFVILLWIFVPIFVKDRVKAGALIHCGFRSNFAILGLPLAKNVLDAVGIAKTEIILAFGVPLFNIVAVIVLAYWSGQRGNFKKIFKNIVTNPLIIGALSGLLFSVFRINIPSFLNTTISYVGNIALGLGLIVLGASFQIDKFVKSFKSTIMGSLIKVVISPIFGVTLAYLFGFRGAELVITFILFGSSTAINSYIMAHEMGSDSELTSGIVVCTTGLSVITLFIGIFMIKSLGIY